MGSGMSSGPPPSTPKARGTLRLGHPALHEPIGCDTRLDRATCLPVAVVRNTSAGDGPTDDASVRAYVVEPCGGAPACDRSPNPLDVDASAVADADWSGCTDEAWAAGVDRLRERAGPTPRSSARAQAPPAACTWALVVAGDIWGDRIPWTRMWADRFAQAGFLVVLPELLRGKVWPHPELDSSNWDGLEPWLRKHPDERVVDDCRVVVRYLRSRGATRIGFVGFCWGARAAQEYVCVDHDASDTPGDAIDAAVSMHGCYLRMHERGPALRRPVAYLCGADDGATPPEKRDKILRDMEASAHLSRPGRICTYPKVTRTSRTRT